MGPALRGAAVIQGGQGRLPLQRDVEDAVPYEITRGMCKGAGRGVRPYKAKQEPRKTGRRGRRAIRIDAGRRGRQNSEIFSFPCPLRRGCGVYIGLAPQPHKKSGSHKRKAIITPLQPAEKEAQKRPQSPGQVHQDQSHPNDAEGRLLQMCGNAA